MIDPKFGWSAAVSIIIITAIFIITGSAIGMECYNQQENSEMKKKEVMEYNMFIVNIVCGICLFIVAFYVGYNYIYKQ
jgi:hypothetical protein